MQAKSIQGLTKYQTCIIENREDSAVLKVTLQYGEVEIQENMFPEFLISTYYYILNLAPVLVHYVTCSQANIFSRSCLSGD